MKKLKFTSSDGFVTAPVFFTAISTILGAILFLRFGYVVGNLGFFGVLLIVLIGHLVTIPTALAISEIATNQKVEGGGEYFIISRSFGLNIGATIGIALFLSQGISVAFYIIAFTEAFSFFFEWMKSSYGIDLPRQVISIPATIILSLLIIFKGANLGVKALYIVVAVLFISLVFFFLGSPISVSGSVGLFDNAFMKPQKFFIVFAIVFPAFTGMTAGVGLSGDLKNPGKSIPPGTIAPSIKQGKKVLITAHGNSLRALVKYLDHIPNNEIVGLNIPTGIPLVYELDDNLKSLKSYYLGDADEIKKAAAAVANQGKAK